MNGEPKYSEEAVAILVTLERIDTRQKDMGDKVGDLHKQLKVHWDKIDRADDRLLIIETERAMEKKWWKRAIGTFISLASGFIGGFTSGTLK